MDQHGRERICDALQLAGQGDAFTVMPETPGDENVPFVSLHSNSGDSPVLALNALYTAGLMFKEGKHTTFGPALRPEFIDLTGGAILRDMAVLRYPDETR